MILMRQPELIEQYILKVETWRYNSMLLYADLNDEQRKIIRQIPGVISIIQTDVDEENAIRTSERYDINEVRIAIEDVLEEMFPPRE